MKSKLPLIPEYSVWVTMRQRCTNPRNKSYANYGGRGILIAQEWDAFPQFYKDMGPRPSSSYTLERKDNEGHYCPSNCVWADRTTQSHNRRCTVFLTFNGETMPIRTWAIRLGLKPRTLHARIQDRGWPVERALTEGVSK